MKHTFIINPISGNIDKTQIKKIISNICTEHQLDYEIIETQYKGHDKKIAEEKSSPDTILYACGGDGTVHGVLNGMKDGIFSVLPVGTGNDFYRMIKGRNDIDQLIADTISGEITSIDYATCNGYKYLSSTSMGLDARVNNMVNEMLKNTIIPKSLLYVLSAIINIFNPKPFHLHIKIDEKEIEKDAVMVAIMNGRYYGNGVAPDTSADIQDGLLNVIVVDKVGLPKLIYCLPHYFSGKIDNVKEIQAYTAKHIEISSDVELCCQSDGENYFDHNMVIDMHHNELRYLKPKDSYLK